MARQTDLIPAQVQCSWIAHHAVDLASNLAHAAETIRTGGEVYVEAALKDIASLRDCLAIVEAALQATVQKETA